MSILIYLGVLALCYGIYNTLCYICILPSVNAGTSVSKCNKRKKVIFSEIALIEIAKEIVGKFDLKWNRSETLEEILKKDGIYFDGTIYLISRFIKLILGFFVIFPVIFINKRLFVVLITICVIWLFIEVIGVLTYGSDIRIKQKKKWIEIMCKLLPGAFFIAQSIVLIHLLT